MLSRASHGTNADSLWPFTSPEALKCYAGSRMASSKQRNTKIWPMKDRNAASPCQESSEQSDIPLVPKRHWYIQHLGRSGKAWPEKMECLALTWDGTLHLDLMAPHPLFQLSINSHRLLISGEYIVF